MTIICVLLAAAAAAALGVRHMTLGAAATGWADAAAACVGHAAAVAEGGTPAACYWTCLGASPAMLS